MGEIICNSSQARIHTRTKTQNHKNKYSNLKWAKNWNRHFFKEGTQIRT